MKKTLFSDFIKKDIELSKRLYPNVREYAKSVGVSHTVIHDMMNGKYDSPTPLTASRMCVWFKLEPDELCEMINNVNDAFKEELNNRLLGDTYEESCHKVLDSFFKKYENKDLRSGTIHAPTDPFFSPISIINPKYNRKHTSRYTDEYDAMANVSLYDFIPIENPDKSDCEYKCKIIKEAECAYYFLPARRIYDIKSEHYKDDFIRDFTNKFMSIINNPKAPKNNIFVTPSDNVLIEILKFTCGSGIKSKYGVGIGVVCSRFNRFDQWHVIVENDSIITYPNED